MGDGATGAAGGGFDPYRRWLAIPPGRRPPTHYQLLGVAPDEVDVEVIHAAAVRQTAYVRNFQAGPHAADAARVLSELAEARSALTDPARRRQYDGRLAGGGGGRAAPTDPAAGVPGTAAKPDEDVETFGRPRRAVRRTPARSRAPLVVGAAVLVVGAIAAAVGIRSSARRPVDPPAATAPTATPDVPPTHQAPQTVAAAAPPPRRQRTGMPLTVKPAEATAEVVAGAATVAGGGESRRLVVERPGEKVTVRVEAAGYEPVTRAVTAGDGAAPVVVELAPARKWLTDLPAPTRTAAFPTQKVGEHSFSMHPPGRDRGHAAAGYEIGGGYRTFHGKATMLRSAGADSDSPMVFAAFGDGKLLWASDPIQLRGESDECVCDVTGVRRLELRVRCAAGNGNAWGAWIDPHLVACEAHVAAARAAREKRPSPGAVETEAFWAAERKPAARSAPKLMPVYKVVFPGDVLLTTNEQEVNNLAKAYPGKFAGGRGHYQEVFGYAYADRQEGTVLLRRYLNSTTMRHEFVTSEIDLNIHKFYKQEGMGAWVCETEQPGTTPRRGFFRVKDARYEYGLEKKEAEFFRRLGYAPTALEFYLFDKGGP